MSDFPFAAFVTKNAVGLSFDPLLPVGGRVESKASRKAAGLRLASGTSRRLLKTKLS